MKKFCVVVGVAIALGASGLSTKAYAGHWHGHGCDLWPLFPLSIGLGIGLGYLESRSSYYYPPSYVYAYPQPVYVSPPPAVTPAPAVPAAPLAPPVVERPAWVPSSPGAGRWVPDTAPDRYVPGGSAGSTVVSAPAMPPSTVNIAKSAGGVPVYSVRPGN